MATKLETPPFDARFPNTNQTKNCWQNYLDFHRCNKVKGEDSSVCLYFKQTYMSLCPDAWVCGGVLSVVYAYSLCQMAAILVQNVLECLMGTITCTYITSKPMPQPLKTHQVHQVAYAPTS